MNKIFQITLGIVTAVGGFIDIGELVFSVHAGARFGFLLLWAIIVGTIGITIYSEMCGRIAAVIHKPVFILVKQRLGYNKALTVLIASTALSVLTCAAEVGGVTIALQLLTGIDYLSSLVLTITGFIVVVWLAPFEIIEKMFGLLGVLMIIFLVANVQTGVHTQQLLQGLTPTLPNGNTNQLFPYLYFAVGIISSSMMPYEVYFYSSGGIEEKWTPRKLLDNHLTAIIGMSLGAILSASLMMLGAKVFAVYQISPDLMQTSVLAVAAQLGKWGAVLALLGILFAIGGAVIETCLASAYNIAQFFEWPWGLHMKKELAPAFNITWILVLLFSFFVILVGIDPVDLVEYAVIFSVIALPFTYYPILQVANNKNIMGKYANGKLINILGWVYFFIVCILALSAIPLMIITHSGKV